jgi:hypothetical protein
VIEAWIVVIRPAQHYDPDAILALELIENVSGLALHPRLVFFQRLESRLDGPVISSGDSPRRDWKAVNI